MQLRFTSIHCYLDPSSGAALCPRELLNGRGMREHFSCANTAEAAARRLVALTGQTGNGPRKNADEHGSGNGKIQDATGRENHFKKLIGSFPPDPRSPALIRAAMSSSRRARISLAMIVRDEERNLPACLTSVEGLCDETVVVATGSGGPRGTW